jgi:hypothetical protein
VFETWDRESNNEFQLHELVDRFELVVLLGFLYNYNMSSFAIISD